MENSKNFIIAILSAVLIFIGWQYYYEKPRLEKRKAEIEKQEAQQKHQDPASVLQVEATPQVDVPKNRQEVLSSTRRIQIKTPTLKGSIRVQGGRIDDLVLTQYKEGLEKEDDFITLFSPSGSQNPYFAEFGWVSGDRNLKLPTANTNWTVQGQELSPGNPVVLTWDNGAGLLFERTISVDDQYLFTIKQRVKNTTSRALALNSYGLISRTGTPKTSGFFILHEGPLAFLEEGLKEYSYGDLQDDKLVSHDSKGGWLGITDKYWLSALIPDQKMKLKTNFRDINGNNKDRYQVDYLTDVYTLQPGQSLEHTTNLFAGAKVLEILDQYEETLGVQHFDKAVDFGWFYFITKPFFYGLTYLHKVLGNFGLAILALTVLLKILFLPLANKSYRSMARMKEVQPKMERLRELYGEDKMRLNQEVMALYKKEKVNPMSGCLPMLIQIPVFFALYKVLFVSIEMRQAPFYGWIKDLSIPDPTTLFNLFGLIPWDPPSFLMIGAWPLIMGVTMFLQQKMNPPPADPIQQKVFMFMPIMFTIMLAGFPAGLVIYWAWNNVISIGQQWLIMKNAKRSK